VAGVTTYRADWILPIVDDPIHHGWVAVDRGRIAGLGAGPVPAQDIGHSVILPSLVNAHTHLELSYLRSQIPPATRFIDWIRAVMERRRQQPDGGDPQLLEAARDAIRQARSCGTGLLGEVSNTLRTIPLLLEERMRARVFHELIGFSEPHPWARVAAARERIDALGLQGDDLRVALAAHAPYSVSPALFAAIRADLDGHPPPVSTVHLAESGEEIELLHKGTGEWRTLLEELGVWTDEWGPPGLSPVQYLSSIGFLDRSVLAVHGVQLEGEDLSRLSALGVTLVSCPRSNRYVGVGCPPLEAFYAMDVDVAFGTDSLASVTDLNLFAELAESRRIAPRVPARRLLESATLTAARALGFERDLGSIEPGKRASLIAVRVPEHCADVEEYLVSGIEPDAVEWLDAGDGRAARSVMS
jgi:aminodeoxyfutalosine deaminase